MWFHGFWHCLAGKHGCGGFGCDLDMFGAEGGIVEWFEVSGGWEQVLRCVVLSNCSQCHCGCANAGWRDFKQDGWGCAEPFDPKMLAQSHP